MITLFVRSYYKDFEWLDYSVKSMRKNLTGISERILAVPQHTVVPASISSFFDHIVYTEETHPGYIAQQLDKIRAYKYCSNDYILFSDSDCIYYKPFDVHAMLDDGRCILYKTHYEELRSHPTAFNWNNVVRVAIGIQPTFEYMRCMPLLHHKDTLRVVDGHGLFNKYIARKNIELSEFNIIGTIAEHILPHLYTLKDTIKGLPQYPLPKQYWSWGGITSNIREELNVFME